MNVIADSKTVGQRPIRSKTTTASLMIPFRTKANGSDSATSVAVEPTPTTNQTRMQNIYQARPDKLDGPNLQEMIEQREPGRPSVEVLCKECHVTEHQSLLSQTLGFLSHLPDTLRLSDLNINDRIKSADVIFAVDEVAGGMAMVFGREAMRDRLLKKTERMPIIEWVIVSGPVEMESVREIAERVKLGCGFESADTDESATGNQDSGLPMTVNHPQWDEFVNELNDRLNFRLKNPDDPDSLTWTCKGGDAQPMARQILTEMRFTPEQIERSVLFFRENGGYCDCEVLFNVAQ